MVYLNAFTNTVAATAERPADMSPETFAHVEAECRAGRMCDVAHQMMRILRANNPHPDCFLVPSKPVVDPARCICGWLESMPPKRVPNPRCTATVHRYEG
jgi:hypothetical protein